MEKKILKTKQDIDNLLSHHKISFKEYKHKPALTIDDLKTDPGKFEKSPFIKNLVYVEKNKYYFLILEGDTNVSKDFWQLLGSNKNKVRFAQENHLQALHALKGAINIFNVLNAQELEINLAIDEKLDKVEYWNFHPQTNEATYEIKKKDILNLLNENKISYKFFNMEFTKENLEKENKFQDETKGETKLKIEADKTKNFAEWYTQVIIKANLIDYYDVSGCYILKPDSYFIWEQIQSYLDKSFKSLGVQNVYFPMFVSKGNLEKEEKHLEGFKAEVAWVTKYGTSDLTEPVAIRPTSETIMYPSYANWIHSHRDLPLLLNQWTNIVRWEFKHPTPFIRTREFLWQEGHTAHENKEESSEFVFKILDLYEDCYKNLLAIPVIKGIKSENEKFGGADFTSTCETFITENGRAIQACTSHQLGENFAKMFGIKYQSGDKIEKYVSQTSWGFTTRSIGIIVMMHGDNKGLVLPPLVANVQVVIVPIVFKDVDLSALMEKSKQIRDDLKKQNIRATLDDRDNVSSGRKYNEWEIKGVPIRLEFGPKDLENNEMRLVRRFDGEKKQVKIEGIVEVIKNEFKFIQEKMYERAKEKLLSKTAKATNWQEFMQELNKMQIVKTPWCKNTPCEEEVKIKSKKESVNIEGETLLSGSAKTLCMPLQQETLEENQKCFNCGEKALSWVLWGRSY